MKRIISILILIVPLYLRAQNTLYFMDRVPQCTSLNPALTPGVRFYLSVGGTSINMYNSGFTYNEIKSFTDNLGTKGYNPDEFLHSIGEYDKFLTEMQANVFSLGFKLKEKGYISIALNMNSLTELKANSKIAYLLNDLSNLSLESFPITIDGIDLRTSNYLSLGFTYSRKITKHFTLGISPHLNLNLLGIETSNLSYTVNLDESDEENIRLPVTFSGQAQVGLPFEINAKALQGDQLDLNQKILPDNLSDYFTVPNLLKNKSFSVDIGGTYSIKKWTFSASILNIGNLAWQTNGYNITGNNENFQAKKAEKIVIGIPEKILVGLNQQFARKWNLGILFRKTAYYWETEKTTTLSLNGNIGKSISTSFSYTAGSKYNDFGAGIRTKTFLGIESYIIAENLAQLLKPKDANRFFIAYGMTIALGNK